MGKKILISWLGTTDLKAANQIPSRPDEIIEAMIERPKQVFSSELPEIGSGIDVQQVLDDIKRNDLTMALKKAAGNKKEATELLGLPNYQTLSNWIEKLDVQ